MAFWAMDFLALERELLLLFLALLLGGGDLGRLGLGLLLRLLGGFGRRLGRLLGSLLLRLGSRLLLGSLDLRRLGRLGLFARVLLDAELEHVVEVLLRRLGRLG